MKKVIASTLLCLSIMTLGAQEKRQEIEYGIRVGMNVSSMGISADRVSLSPDSKVGFNIGIAAEIPVSKTNEALRINTGLYYTIKGFKLSEDGEKLTSSPAYLQIPVYASWRTPLTDDIKLRINAGPYFALGVNGKNKITDGRLSEKEDCFGHGGYKRFDMGLGLSVGLAFNKFIFDIGYEHGLINISPDDDVKFRNRNFTFTLGYNF